jgi:hypothetical protein
VTRACTSLALCAIGLYACGDDDAAQPPPADLREDARAIAEILADDPTPAALVEVDDAILDDLPVRAAEMLESGAIPAARRQVEAAEALDLGTPDGRQLRNRVVTAMRARVHALEAYRDALARGEVEDLQLAQALREQRAAEASIAEASVAVEALLD